MPSGEFERRKLISALAGVRLRQVLVDCICVSERSCGLGYVLEVCDRLDAQRRLIRRCGI